MNPIDIPVYVAEVGRRARAAARHTARAATAAKDAALIAAAAAIRRQASALAAANAKDLEAARAAGHDAAFVDRLELTPKVIESMAVGLEQIAALPDPVGEISDMAYRPSGIQVGKMRVPLGVIGIIYEARPNVTADAAALCLKSGNAAILRGGSHYQPAGAIWYFPQAYRNDQHGKLLLMAPSYDRSGTVGFRCVSDAP